MNHHKPWGAYMPRLLGWMIFTAVIFGGLYFVHPQQMEIALYKLALICLAAVIGYWLNRVLFPYARPDGYLVDFWQRGTDEPIGQADYEVVEEYRLVFALVMLRRALIMFAVILGMCTAL